MEQLTKQQVILLAIFVSLFSSAVTAIIAVSLSTPATPAVTETVNHVIERTIPSSASSNGSVQTIVERTDQATVRAIDIASRSVVRIAGGNNQFIAVGAIVSTGGKVVAKLGPTGSQKLSVHLPDGVVAPLAYLSTDTATGLSLFLIGKNASSSAETFVPAALANSDSVKLGQTVILIAGTYSPAVSTGFVAALAPGRIIAGTAVPVTGFDSQAILVNLIGEVVGIVESASPANISSQTKTANSASFIPSNLITTYASS